MGYFDGIECPVCYESFKDGDEIVVCPVCGTPYHKDCYKKAGKCIHESEHHSYVFEMPKKIIEEVKISNDENKVICKYCGEENDNRNIVCQRCGKSLEMPTEMFAFGPNLFFGRNDEKVSGIPVKDWISFIGPSALYYIMKFKSIEKKGYSLLEFNWGACIFKGLYFLYRKMYAVGIMLLLLYVLLPMIIACIFLPEGAIQTITTLCNSNISFQEMYKSIRSLMDNNPQVIQTFNFLWFIISIIIGAVSTRIYKRFCEKKIKSIKREDYSDERIYSNELTKRGSVNMNLICIIAFILLFLINFVYF